MSRLLDACHSIARAQGALRLSDVHEAERHVEQARLHLCAVVAPVAVPWGVGTWVAMIAVGSGIGGALAAYIVRFLEVYHP